MMHSDKWMRLQGAIIQRMTKKLEEAIARVRELAEKDQDRIDLIMLDWLDRQSENACVT